MRRIEECRVSKAAVLDLSELALSSIPVEVGELVWLEVLILNHNEIQKIENLQFLSKLQRLYLRSNNISKIENLQCLIQLQHLHLSDNQITKIENLHLLTQLQHLHLSDNQISKIENLHLLTPLQYLSLGNNKISKIENLQSLIQLQYLYLYKNQITKIENLHLLNQVQHLDLSNNQISKIENLHLLTLLQYLYLNNNKILKIENLQSLIQLQYLHLDSNQISKIENLHLLTPLQHLLLGRNRISKIENLQSLIQLQYLSLYKNQISKIEGLKQLTQLQELSLERNQIQKIQGLSHLTQLEYLNLQSNQITKIEELDQLQNLRILFFQRNTIQKIQGLQKLTNLKNLYLHHNQITKIEGLKHLSNLVILYLNNNPIKQVKNLEELEKLQLLHLSNTPIKDLHFTTASKTLLELPMYWKEPTIEEDIAYEYEVLKPGIYLHNCTQLVEPSPEWVKLGQATVHNYFQALKQQGKTTLREAKLMLVGRPNLGKTTLSAKLRDVNNPMPVKDASTRGIEVKDWKYTLEKEEYTIRIWDFGGQDIQYAIHQFFMTARTIYVLLNSTREYNHQQPGSEYLDHYWLQVIEKMANKSPTFHVYNKYKGQESNTSVHHSLRAAYPFLQEQPTVVNLNEVQHQPQEQAYLQQLQQGIQTAVQELPNVGLVLPQKWAAIRTALLALKEEHQQATLSLENYEQLCRDHAIESEEVMLLISRYLHEIGSIIHYNQEPSNPLYHLLILEREWATEAVYAVALSQRIKDQYGVFIAEDLPPIWQEQDSITPQRLKSYQKRLPALLQLLVKFEICYLYNQEHQQYLVPKCLPFQCPSNLPAPSADAVRLQFNYPFMPYGIVNRLAVRLHHYINDKQIWRTGVVFTKEKGAATAWVSVTETRDPLQQQKIIQLTSSGDQTLRYFLQERILEELEKLHEIYNISDQVALMVPCICLECSESKEPYLFDYKKDLLHKLKKGKKPSKECQRSCDDVDILKLIDHAFYERPPEVKSILYRDQHIYLKSGDYIAAQEKNVIKDSTFKNSNAQMGDQDIKGS